MSVYGYQQLNPPKMVILYSYGTNYHSGNWFKTRVIRPGVLGYLELPFTYEV